MTENEVTVTQADKKLAEAIIAVEHNNNHAEYEYNVASVIAQHRTRSVDEGIYTVSGIRTSEEWSFDWYVLGPDGEVAYCQMDDGKEHAEMIDAALNDRVSALAEPDPLFAEVVARNAQLETLLYTSPKTTDSVDAVRCPACHVVFQEIADVDSHLASLPKTTDSVDAVREALGKSQKAMAWALDTAAWIPGRDQLKAANEAALAALAQPAGEGS